jgi:multiple sugar transport system permease protein
VVGQSRSKEIVSVIAAVLILVVMLFPVYWTIVASLKTDNQIYKIPPTILPPTPTLTAYATSFTTEWQQFVSSLIIAVGTVIVSIGAAAPAAFALAHFRFRFASFVVISLLLAQIIPSVIIANSIYVIFNKLGLLNTYLGLIIADSSLGIPFAVLILRAFMLSIPAELPEAARVDGASDFTTFVRIILPVSRTAVITASLFSFLFAWGDFLFALTVITKEAKQPITLGLFKFIGAFSVQWNDIMATAVLASIPAAVLLIVAQRYVAAGLTAGSIKS